jgi:hypothetical protein
MDPVAEEYARAAKDYDSNWSFYVEATTRETMSRIEMQPEDRVLDPLAG